jgi:hypothetical protein
LFCILTISPPIKKFDYKSVDEEEKEKNIVKTRVILEFNFHIDASIKFKGGSTFVTKRKLIFKHTTEV